MSETKLIDGYDPQEPDFKVWTSPLTQSFNPLFQESIGIQSDSLVFMTGSSTVKDLHGDTMELTALQDMTSVDPRLSIFLNHDYSLPDKLYGSLAASPIMTQQKEIADLHLAVETETENPAAMQTLSYIKKGRRLGCSGGFKVLDYDLDLEGIDEDDDFAMFFAPLRIKHVYTVEFSVVGVPSCQRAWVENAAHGIFLRSLAEGKDEEARRLAPIVKSLFAREFRQDLKRITNENLVRDLERLPDCKISNNKILWEPVRMKFLLSLGGQDKEINRDEVHQALTRRQVEQDLLKKGACGKTSWPLADYGTSWDGSAAESQIFNWATPDGAEDFTPSKARQCFFYCDDADPSQKGSYKLPFCRVADGGPQIVPKGVQAVAGALQGARGGLKGVSDADIASIKRKVETLYNRINKEFDKDLKVPWKDEEKGEDGDMEGKQFESPIEDLVIEADGTHAPTSGSHSHAHPAYGSQGDDKNHSHKHSHSNDNDHKHSHSDDEEDQQDGGKDEDQEDKSAELTPASDPGKLAMLAAYNSLGAALGLPALDSAMLDGIDGEHPLLLHKALSTEHMTHIHAIHNHLCQMSDNQCCPDGQGMPDGSKGEGSQNNSQPGAETMASAEQRANQERDAMASYQRGIQAIELFTKELGKQADYIPAAKQAYEDLQQKAADSRRELSDLWKKSEEMKKDMDALGKRLEATRATAEQLRSMPLGRPTGMARQIQDTIGLASYDQMRQAGIDALSLEEAYKRTKIAGFPQSDGTFISCRVWPADLVPEGGRPALTSDQLSLMNPFEIMRYEQGQEARVPMIDDHSLNLAELL